MGTGKGPHAADGLAADHPAFASYSGTVEESKSNCKNDRLEFEWDRFVQATFSKKKTNDAHDDSVEDLWLAFEPHKISEEDLFYVTQQSEALNLIPLGIKLIVRTCDLASSFVLRFIQFLQVCQTGKITIDIADGQTIYQLSIFDHKHLTVLKEEAHFQNLNFSENIYPNLGRLLESPQCRIWSLMHTAERLDGSSKLLDFVVANRNKYLVSFFGHLGKYLEFFSLHNFTIVNHTFRKLVKELSISSLLKAFSMRNVFFEDILDEKDFEDLIDQHRFLCTIEICLGDGGLTRDFHEKSKWLQVFTFEPFTRNSELKGIVLPLKERFDSAFSLMKWFAENENMETLSICDEIIMSRFGTDLTLQFMRYDCYDGDEDLDSSRERLLHMVPELPNVTHLGLFSCPRRTMELFFSPTCRVTHFSVENEFDDASDLQYLCTCLSEYSILTNLDLHLDPPLSGFQYSLCPKSALIYLRLQLAAFSELPLSLVATILNEQKHLKELIITGSGFTIHPSLAEDVLACSNLMKNHSSLSRVQLSSEILRDLHSKNIFFAALQNEGIETLIISSCKHRDLDTTIARGITANMTHLKELLLDFSFDYCVGDNHNALKGFEKALKRNLSIVDLIYYPDVYPDSHPTQSVQKNYPAIFHILVRNKLLAELQKLIEEKIRVVPALWPEVFVKLGSNKGEEESTIIFSALQTALLRDSGALAWIALEHRKRSR